MGVLRVTSERKCYEAINPVRRKVLVFYQQCHRALLYVHTYITQRHKIIKEHY